MNEVTTVEDAAQVLRECAVGILSTADVWDPAGATTPGAQLIAEERTRQVREEGHTDDSEYRGNELAWAAFCYLERAAQDRLPQDDPSVPHVWPMPRERWRPKPSRIRNLTIAAALIAAEIDRRHTEGETP